MAPRPRRADLELHDTPARALLRERPGDFPGVDERQLALCQQFLRVAKRSLATFGDAFAAHDLSPGRYAVLMALARADGQLSPSTLASQIGVTRATVTGLVDGLARDGLVLRTEATAGDRRRKGLQLSASGRARLRTLLPPLFAKMVALVAPLHDREQATLQRLLTKLEGALT
ncbi:MAG: MarR family transcriptional regulator, partial [Myxococcales bacterium]|nr:MarR family transcriptional regulator [Myxococcales bacterium]